MKRKSLTFSGSYTSKTYRHIAWWFVARHGLLHRIPRWCSKRTQRFHKAKELLGTDPTIGWKPADRRIPGQKPTACSRWRSWNKPLMLQSSFVHQRQARSGKWSGSRSRSSCRSAGPATEVLSTIPAIGKTEAWRGSSALQWQLKEQSQ